MSGEGKIVALRGSPHGITPGNPVNSSAVEILTKWLERAKRGEVDAIALAVSCPNCEVTTDWSSGLPDAMFRMISAATLLHAEMGQMMLDVARGGESDRT